MDIVKEVLEPQLNDIFNLVEAIDCLYLNLSFIRTNFNEKNEFEKNLIRLEEIKTNLSISRIKKILKAKIKEFDDSITIYDYALKECNYE